MTKFKNVFLLAALAVSAVSFTSCDKESDNENENNNNNNNTQTADTLVISATGVTLPNGETVNTVKALVSGTVSVIATGTYANGGFTLTLRTPTAAQVDTVKKSMASTITVTPADAKGTRVDEIRAYSGETLVGSFHHYKRDGGVTTSVTFYYVDKATILNGSATDSDGITMNFSNLSLQKGWNKVYQTVNGQTVGFTTTEPAGLAWGFDAAN